MKTLTPTLLLTCALLACQDVQVAEYPDPTSLQTETTQNGISLSIVSPVTSLSSTPLVDLELRVRNEDPGSERKFIVLVGLQGGLLQPANNVTGTEDLYRRRLSLAHGRNTITVEVRGEDGQLLRDARFTIQYDGNLPGIALLGVAQPGAEGCNDAVPLAQPLTNQPSVCVFGETTGSGTQQIDRVEVEFDSGQVQASLLENNQFSVRVPLSLNSVNTLRLVATNQRGESSRATLEVQQDSIAPELVISAPQGNPIQTDLARLNFDGTLSDNVAVETLRFESGTGGVTFIPPDPFWNFEFRLENGANNVTLVATDSAGNETRIPLEIQRNRIIRLAFPDEGRSRSSVRLDRTALQSFISEDEAREVELVQIPLRNTVEQTLRRLVDPERYGVDTSLWGDAEWNLQRLLVTSPDTADVTGSSLEEMNTLSYAIGLPTPRLLAELVDIDVEDAFLPVDVLTEVLLDQLVATHPRVEFDDEGEPVIRVTLADTLNDLADLGPRFGPAGDHPGFLEGETLARVLEPGFAMTIDAFTNLREHQGVDASAGGKDFLFVRQGDQVVDFDFLNPDSFAVVGLVNEPTVDLRFIVQESPQFFTVGTERLQGTIDGVFRGNGTAWDAEPWVLERLIVEGIFRGYQDRFADTGWERTLRYAAGAVSNAAVITWQRGWVTIDTTAGLGSPPAPFYAWDLLLEIAQLRLHDGGLREGEANVAFVLQDLPVGITADELIDAMRPTLQEQTARLSELLVGSQGIAQTQVDVYLVASTSPTVPGYLFQRIPEDSVGGAPIARPGFFSDPALTQRVSQLGSAPGSDDTTHEKVPVAEGLSVYFADDENKPWQLRVVAADAEGVSVIVSAVGGTP